MFLKRLYNEWRLLFWIVIFFMLAQVFFMAKAIENIPFFLYHMYSQEHRLTDSTPVYLIKTPNGYFDHKKLSNREQEILTNSVSYYVNLEHDGDGINESIKKRFAKFVSGPGYTYLQKQLSNDSLAMAKFPDWWRRYFQSITKNDFDSVTVVKSYVYKQPPYNKAIADSVIFTVKLK